MDSTSSTPTMISTSTKKYWPSHLNKDSYIYLPSPLMTTFAKIKNNNFLIKNFSLKNVDLKSLKNLLCWFQVEFILVKLQLVMQCKG